MKENPNPMVSLAPNTEENDLYLKA
jgi:hypothetical protein